jgi:Mn-dependent DtxR family transcriptional regulator
MQEEKKDEFLDIPESYQEYLETIYRLSLKTKNSNNSNISAGQHIITNIDIAEFMHIKPSSVTNMLRKLSSKKLIIWTPRSKDIKLTPSGQRIGKNLVHNHLIIELFLQNTLGISERSVLHKLACELEHHLSNSISNVFSRILGKHSNKIIDEYLESGLEIEKFDWGKLKSMFLPEQIIERFCNQIIAQRPDLKDILEQNKTEFFNNY